MRAASPRAAVRAALLAGACAAASCADPPAPYAWPPDATAALDVRIREELLPLRVAREVRLTARGPVAEGGADGGRRVLDLRVVAVRHERFRDGRSEGAVDTGSVAADRAGRSVEDDAVATVAEALVGAPVRATFDPRNGLTSFGGIADALASLRLDADAAEAAEGLRGLLADDAWLRGLRAAGLCATLEDFRDRSAPVRREASVAAPGRGIVTFELSGDVGFDTDGAPIVRWSGNAQRGAPPAGLPGDAPPPEVGEVLTDRIEGTAETLHDPVSHVPLRGTFTSRVPFSGGATVVTTWSFLLTVSR